MEGGVIQTGNSETGYHSRLYVALAVAVVLWLIRYLPFLFPHARLWGINHLLFLPPVWTYVYLAGGCLILLTLIPPARGGVPRLFASVAESLIERRPRLKLIIFLAAATAVFWIFRLPVKLLGDSQTVMANVGGQAPVILKWSEAASIYTVYAVSKFLPFTGTELGRYAYEIVSVLSGALTLLFAGGIAYELAGSAARRLFLFLLIIFAGWIVLFFGYTENYPLLWIFLTGYVYYGIRYAKGRGRLLWPTVFLLAAIAIHLQTLFFAVSYPVLVFSRGRALQYYLRRKKLIWGMAAALAVTGIAIFAFMYRHSFELPLIIIPFFRGHPMTPHYWLFSPTHLLDIVNEFLLVTPLLPVLAVLGWKSPRTIFAEKSSLFLGVLGLGGLVFIFLIDPKLGMARDWDLFAFAGLPWLLLFAGNFMHTQKIGIKLYPAVILASGLMVSPWVATNLHYQPAMDNFKYALNLDLSRSRSALLVLRGMYLNAGDSTTADSINQVLYQKFPSMHLYPDAEKLIGQGRLDEAKVLIDSMQTLDPTMVEFLTLRGYWNLERRDYYAALKDFKQAAVLGKYVPVILANLAHVYLVLHRYKPMIEVLRRGQYRDPDSKGILIGFVTGFTALRQYDSAAVYANKLIALYPHEPDAQYIFGMTALKLGRAETARSYLMSYLKIAPDGVYAKRAEEALKELK